jgi:hypothetical protein
MIPVNLFTVDHRKPAWDPTGGIVTSIRLDKVTTLFRGLSFADMEAQYLVWKNGPTYGIIGFQGYRKHLDFRHGAEVTGDWVSMTPNEFRNYQKWQQDKAAHNIQSLLSDCDILTNPPFDVSYNTNIAEDFKVSASTEDWGALENVMRRYGEFDFTIPTVTSYCVLTTTFPVFNEWMKFWWKIVCELEKVVHLPCRDPGPRPDIYLPRRMAFLSERIFALWLHSSGLKVKPLPLLVCWEYK